MHISQMAGDSKWLRAKDVGEDGDSREVTITKVDSEVDNQQKIHYFLLLAEFPDKKWEAGTNKINREAIALQHGENTDLWPGKKITIYVTDVQDNRGATKPGLRVRKPRAGGPAPAGVPDFSAPAKAQVLGEVGEKRLLDRISAFVNVDKTVTLDRLRSDLLIGRGELEPVLSGQPRNWPASLGNEIANWLNAQDAAADSSLPF